MGEPAPVALTMIEPFLDAYYEMLPVNATFTGVHRFDDRLPDWSPNGLARNTDRMRGLRREIHSSLVNREPWAFPESVDLQVADAFLEIQIAEMEGRHFYRTNPSLYTGEAIFGVLSLVTRPFAPLARRLEHAVDRMHAIGPFFNGAIATVGDGPVPEGWIARARRECVGALAFFEHGLNRLFAAGGNSTNASLAADDAVPPPLEDDVRRAATRAANAFRHFDEWLERLPSTSVPGATSGAELFDLLLARGHWCNKSRADLLREARARFADAEHELQGRSRAIDPDGWPAVRARLETDYPSTGDYLPSFERIWSACHERATSTRLVPWPDFPIRYRPIPVHTRDAAPYLYYLFYRSPAAFDHVPVHDYVVTPVDETQPPHLQEATLRANNFSVIKLNHVVHHGAIGHHVQNFYAYRSPSRVGQIAAIDCASRIGMFCGGTMAEGWACYATELMEEVGFLTAVERAAEAHTRLRLLARAIVDIEFHQGTFTAQDARLFYEERVGMAPGAAAAEVVKNSMFPGTAAMYWLGTDAIHALRRERQRVEGSQFSLEEFHRRFLSCGSLPVPLIARLFDAH